MVRCNVSLTRNLIYRATDGVKKKESPARAQGSSYSVSCLVQSASV